MGLRMSESAKPYFAMICLQFGYAGMNLVTKTVLDRGMSHYVLVAYRNAFATAAIAPFAFLSERYKDISTHQRQTVNVPFDAFCNFYEFWGILQESEVKDDVFNIHAHICSCSSWVSLLKPSPKLFSLVECMKIVILIRLTTIVLLKQACN